ncbi:hypothetical protein [Bradyrhizobium cosmicum]|nr:hypothetical protein [Bradyrhizobium cosmicum]
MLIFKNGAVEIWDTADGYFVYGVTNSGDPICCPSLGMAYEVAAR